MFVPLQAVGGAVHTASRSRDRQMSDIVIDAGHQKGVVTSCATEWMSVGVV